MVWHMTWKDIPGIYQIQFFNLGYTRYIQIYLFWKTDDMDMTWIWHFAKRYTWCCNIHVISMWYGIKCGGVCERRGTGFQMSETQAAREGYLFMGWWPSLTRTVTIMIWARFESLGLRLGRWQHPRDEPSYAIWGLIRSKRSAIKT